MRYSNPEAESHNYPPHLVLDNGRDQVTVPLEQIDFALARSDLPPALFNGIKDKVLAYAGEVTNRLQEGIHLGSADLVKGIVAEISMMEFSTIGISAREQKLILELIESLCRSIQE